MILFRRVTNFNDITHHFLHCIYVHLELTKSNVLRSHIFWEFNFLLTNHYLVLVEFYVLQCFMFFHRSRGCRPK